MDINYLPIINTLNNKKEYFNRDYLSLFLINNIFAIPSTGEISYGGKIEIKHKDYEDNKYYQESFCLTHLYDIKNLIKNNIKKTN